MPDSDASWSVTLMMTFLGSRLDRSGMVLVNTRLDGYPAYFHVKPAAIAAFLGVTLTRPDDAARLVDEEWSRLAAPFEALVRRHGQDFIVDETMLQHR